MTTYLITCWNKGCRRKFEYNTDNRKRSTTIRKLTPFSNPERIIVKCPFCGTDNSVEID